jgi:hypothetical protein
MAWKMDFFRAAGKTHSLPLLHINSMRHFEIHPAKIIVNRNCFNFLICLSIGCVVLKLPITFSGFALAGFEAKNVNLH